MALPPFNCATAAADEAEAMRRAARALLALADTTGAPTHEVETMRAVAQGLIAQADELQGVPVDTEPAAEPAGVTVALDQIRALQAVSRELLALVNALVPAPGAAVLVGSAQGLARALARRLEALGW
jgi:hypothetical protein